MSAYWPLSPGILLPLARSLPKRMLVTPFEDGPPASRRRFLGAPGTMSGTVRLTGADFLTFHTWGEGTLTDWTQPFSWRDPLDASLRTFQFAGEPDCRLETVGDSADSLRTVWTCSISLWVTA